jgi:8-oxo-dGTP pyrophosphatase MutT (NUDIX family)
MHRKAILDILDLYLRRYPDEEGMVDRIRSLVTRQPDCFERTCQPGHITGSAWVVSADFTRYLLTHHRKLDRWLQLGGHADGQTDPSRVALREAEEESGMTGFTLVETDGRVMPIDVDVHLIPARASEPAHEHHDLRYLLIAPADRTIRASDESHAVRWFTRNQLLEATREESILRMLRKGERILEKGMRDEG